MTARALGDSDGYSGERRRVAYAVLPVQDDRIGSRFDCVLEGHVHMVPLPSVYSAALMTGPVSPRAPAIVRLPATVLADPFSR